MKATIYCKPKKRWPVVARAPISNSRLGAAFENRPLVLLRGSGARRQDNLCAQQLIDGDRQIADALSSGVIDCIGDRRRGSDDSDFTDAFDPERIDLVVFLIDEDHVDRMYIRVYRHVIIGKIMGHK